MQVWLVSKVDRRGVNGAWESVWRLAGVVEGQPAGRRAAVESSVEEVAVQHQQDRMVEKSKGRLATVSSPREAVQIRPAGHQGDDVASEGE
jgi:hypothetical protein